MNKKIFSNVTVTKANSKNNGTYTLDISPSEVSSDKWFYNISNEVGLVLKKNSLKEYKTAVNQIETFNNDLYGKVMSLNDQIVISSRWSSIYYEMLVLPAIMTHNSPSQVLVINGGNGYAVRELLKDDRITEIFLVEKDVEYVEISKSEFPELKNDLINPKVKVISNDPLNYIQMCPSGAFDIIIIDNVFLNESNAHLFSMEFYQHLNRVMKNDSIMMTKAPSILYSLENYKFFNSIIYNVFDSNMKNLTVNVPYINGGIVNFFMCYKSSNNDNFTQIDYELCASIMSKTNVEYYTPDQHLQSIKVPNILKNMF